MKRKITNVRSLLERTEYFCEHLMEVNTKYGANLGSAFIEEANSIRFMAKTILRLNKKDGNRKDVMVPR